jgi:predicted phage terminase large subunit-like protein
MKELLEKIFLQIKKTPDWIQAYEDLYYICLETKKTDIPLAVEYLKKLSDYIEHRILQAVTDEELHSLFLLHKKVLLAAAPFDFESYLLYVEWERDPDKKFYVPRREVMRPVVQAMQELIDDKLDLLTISMPPGTGKSTLGIFFLSWVMGRFPDSQSLASAHSGILTRSFYDGVYQIITDSEYLWANVFPGVKLAATNSKEETIDLHKKHRFSTLTCRAINGSLTGATRCDKILYADDLCSGIEEAMNKERLDKLWNTYTNDLKSRKKEGAKEIHIATRWSVHDVIGRLEQQYGSDPRSRFIVLPALDADGESNFNYGYGVGFSKEYFEDMRENLDDASFRALFQNEPIEREGLLYDVDELRRYFELPAEDPDAIIGICDTKDKGSDYAFLPVVYVYGNDYYIDDCVCDNNLPNIVDARLVDILLRCKVKMCRFESNSAGGRVAEKVQKDVKDKGGITHVTTKFTKANKETRIIINSAWVKEHCLFKDDSQYKRQSDYGRMMSMLCSYTVSGRNRHDDVPDGMAMLADFAQSLSGSEIKVFQRPW